MNFDFTESEEVFRKEVRVWLERNLPEDLRGKGFAASRADVPTAGVSAAATTGVPAPTVIPPESDCSSGPSVAQELKSNAATDRYIKLSHNCRRNITGPQQFRNLSPAPNRRGRVVQSTGAKRGIRT